MPEAQAKLLYNAITNRYGRLALRMIYNGIDVKQQWPDESSDAKADDVKAVMLRGGKGSSALMEAAFFGLAEVTRACIERGAVVDMDNANGDTALTLAARG